MKSFSPHSIAVAIDACKRILGKYHKVSYSDKQGHFLSEFENIVAESENMPDIEAIASFDYVEINKFLEESGFSIKLPPFPNQDYFGTASILKVILKWKEKCNTRTVITTKKEEFPGIVLDAKKYKLGKKDIYSVEDKQGYKVFISPNFKWLVEYDEINLYDSGLMISGPHEEVNLVCPMIDYNEGGSLEWLNNLTIIPEEEKKSIFRYAKLETALQQNIFKMDEIGAKVESASVIGFSGYSGLGNRNIEFIRDPFLLWIFAPNCKTSLFVGYFEEKYWKKPTG